MPGVPVSYWSSGGVGPRGEAAAAANCAEDSLLQPPEQWQQGVPAGLRPGQRRGAPCSAGPFLCSRRCCEEHQAFNICQVPAHHGNLSQQMWRLPFSSANRPANVNSAGFRGGSFLCPRPAGPCGGEMLRHPPSLCWQPVPAGHPGTQGGPPAASVCCGDRSSSQTSHHHPQPVPPPGSNPKPK